jgi:CPA1 family monovalent cation:H+ antiporter
MTPTLPSVLAIIGFAFLIVTLTALARRLPVPTPILQVAAGLLVGLLPGSSLPTLNPDLVFFVFLPPILWSAAYGTSLRDFKTHLRSISILAVALVLVTALAVAVAARALMPGLPWAAAFALGAIVSPPDAIAAEAIITRLPVPRRIVTVLGGESLVNDASALTLYRTAVVAAVTGYFSLGEAIVRFFIDAGIGILIGLFVGWIMLQAARLTRDTLTEVLIGLLGPYVAWVAGESLHVSAVLACVTGGLYVRQRFSTAVAPMTRIQTRAVWNLFIFLLNAVIFIILGVQFGELMAAIPEGQLSGVALAGLVISGVVIAVRLLWVPALAWLPGWLRPRPGRGRPASPRTPPAELFLVGWTSMRGIVSLAAAFGLPLALADGSPFPHRAEMILVTVTVIVVTLVLQGLTLAPLIRRLHFAPDRERDAEEHYAREEALRLAVETLEDMSRETWARSADVGRLREEFRDRVRRLREGPAREHDADCRLRAAILDAERRGLIRLRNENAISDDVLLELEQELDLEALRIGAGERR